MVVDLKGQRGSLTEPDTVVCAEAGSMQLCMQAATRSNTAIRLKIMVALWEKERKKEGKKRKKGRAGKCQ